MMILSEDEANKIKEKMKSEEVLYSWNVIDSPRNIKEELIKSAIAVLFGLLSLSIFLGFIVIGIGITYSTVGITLLSLLLGYLFFRFLVFANIYHEFYITRLGIYSYGNPVIPDICYAVVRGFAWIGVAVCLIALFYVGPVAFVGVGGFALLSFTKLNFKKEITEKSIVFTDHMLLFNIINSRGMKLVSYPRIMDYSLLLYCDDDKKDQFKKIISQLVEHVDIYDIPNYRSFGKHPFVVETVEAVYRNHDGEDRNK